jgi:hypothetical protein
MGIAVYQLSRSTCLQFATLVALVAPMVCRGAMNEYLRQQRTATDFASGASQRTVKLSSDVPKTCPLTKPPDPAFVPPSPYPKEADSHSFWFGTEKLWTRLPTDGTWRGLPHYTPSDPTFRQKLFFWRLGYSSRSGLKPRLTMTGRRLDASAPPLEADEANAGWQQDQEHPFMVTGVNFPTLGCWELTADYQGDRLTFVVWVAP